jgi:hypothetical protein
MEVNECKQVIVQGNQYLIIVGVVGVANVIGRPMGFFLRERVRFIVLQSTLMLGVAISSGIILTKPGLMIEAVMMGIGKLCYSIQMTEAMILQFDVGYFGFSGLALGSALMEASGLLGAVVSTIITVFINPHQAVIFLLVVSLVQIAVICSMTERQ